MAEKNFVEETSIVREIWGKSDTILFIFAGAAAEFALNKAVDWLYYTGKLPSDPLARLFSTVSYARKIVFADHKSALKAIDSITAIHSAVEDSRGSKIPDWAYRDVLFMLIDYSIRSFEVLERDLSRDEKAEVFEVFFRVGSRMGINGLPTTFEQWEIMRQDHLVNNLAKSDFTVDLFKQYRKHLGFIRYRVLVETQKIVVPDKVRNMLEFNSIKLILPVIVLYKICRRIKVDTIVKGIILPSKYKSEIKSLDIVPA